MKKLFIALAFIIATTGCASNPFDTPKIPIPFVVMEVNDQVNQIPYLTDEENYGKEDYWTTPNELYDRGRGDCEDYAIAKYFALREAGISSDHLLLAGGYIDNDPTSGHLVLLYRDKGIVYVLDNIDPDVTPFKDHYGINVQYTFNEHGVRVDNVIYPVSILHKWNRVLRRMKRGL